MEILNFLFPYTDFVLPLTLKKINQNYFGKDEIKLSTGNELYNFLVSPTDSIFMRVESDEYDFIDIHWGDVVIIERNKLKYTGPAAVKIRNEMMIKEITFSKDFEPLIKESGGNMREEDFEYFGTIAYVLTSDEEDFLDILGQELFIII